MFQEISSSATRIVLIILVITLCILAIVAVGFNIEKESVAQGIISLFQNVTIAVVAFYFGQKTTRPDLSENVATDEKTTPTR